MLWFVTEPIWFVTASIQFYSLLFRHDVVQQQYNSIQTPISFSIDTLCLIWFRTAFIQYYSLLSQCIDFSINTIWFRHKPIGFTDNTIWFGLAPIHFHSLPTQYESVQHRYGLIRNESIQFSSAPIQFINKIQFKITDPKWFWSSLIRYIFNVI